jgi:hypothetical protein
VRQHSEQLSIRVERIEISDRPAIAGAEIPQGREPRKVETGDVTLCGGALSRGRLENHACVGDCEGGEDGEDRPYDLAICPYGPVAVIKRPRGAHDARVHCFAPSTGTPVAHERSEPVDQIRETASVY